MHEPYEGLSERFPQGALMTGLLRFWVRPVVPSFRFSRIRLTWGFIRNPNSNSKSSSIRHSSRRPLLHRKLVLLLARTEAPQQYALSSIMIIIIISIARNAGVTVLPPLGLHTSISVFLNLYPLLVADLPP
ncbi:hypothetical protein I3843_03G116900 [Carya illinoinensis]|nr:hypothetical protein I3843_03G116900 [Carya illinoinensis]